MVPGEKWVTTGHKAGPGAVRQYGGADGPGSRQTEPDNALSPTSWQKEYSHCALPHSFNMTNVIMTFSFDGTADLGHPNLMKPGVNQFLRSQSPMNRTRPMV